MNQFFDIYRVAEFGCMIVYERGRWAQRAGLPKYVVARDDGKVVSWLEEFRRRASAIKWAHAEAKDDSHGPRCAQRFHGAAECDCGKADV